MVAETSASSILPRGLTCSLSASPSRHHGQLHPHTSCRLFFLPRASEGSGTSVLLRKSPKAGPDSPWGSHWLVGGLACLPPPASCLGLGWDGSLVSHSVGEGTRLHCFSSFLSPLSLGPASHQAGRTTQLFQVMENWPRGISQAQKANLGFLTSSYGSRWVEPMNQCHPRQVPGMLPSLDPVIVL